MAIMQEKQKKTSNLNKNVYHLLSTVYYLLYTVKKLTWSYQTCLENLCVRQPNKKPAEYSAFQISLVGQGDHEKFGYRQLTTIYYSIQLKR